jgi:hypothetical protein
MTATDARLDRLEERREANVGKQIDNARLPAGAPMYYYCKCCGVLVVTKPEGWFTGTIPSQCEDCKDLIHDGVIDRTNTYDDWLEAHGHPRVPH